MLRLRRRRRLRFRASLTSNAYYSPLATHYAHLTTCFLLLTTYTSLRSCLCSSAAQQAAAADVVAQQAALASRWLSPPAALAPCRSCHRNTSGSPVALQHSAYPKVAFCPACTLRACTVWYYPPTRFAGRCAGSTDGCFLLLLTHE